MKHFYCFSPLILTSWKRFVFLWAQILLVTFEQGDCFVCLTWFCPSDPTALMESVFSIADVSLLRISCQQKTGSNQRIGYLCSPLYLEACLMRLCEYCKIRWSVLSLGLEEKFLKLLVVTVITCQSGFFSSERHGIFASFIVWSLVFSILVFQRDGHSEPTHLFCILNLG